MAGDKVATALYLGTNKLTLVLGYAFLEWVLILLLLLYSLFFYLILKFADFFGLQRPCLWCSQIEHVLEPHKFTNFYTDLLCQSHALEIYDRAHRLPHRRNLAEPQHMCHGCRSSSSSSSYSYSSPSSSPFSSLLSEKKKKMTRRCSCCDGGLKMETSRLLSLPPLPRVLDRPSWGALDYTSAPNSITERGFDDGIRTRSEKEVNGDDGGAGFDISFYETADQGGDGEEASIEFYIDHNELRLVPSGLVHSTSGEKGDGDRRVCEELQAEFCVTQKTAGLVDSRAAEEKECDERKVFDEFLAKICGSQETLAVLESVESKRYQNPTISILDDACEVFSPERSCGTDAEISIIGETHDPLKIREVASIGSSILGADENPSIAFVDVHHACGDASHSQLRSCETDAEVSIVGEMYKLETICEDTSISLSKPDADDDHCESQFSRFTISETNLHEIEVHKVPDGLNSVDQLDKKIMLLEKREVGAEESVDGSIMSEFESGEWVLNLEHLKSALKAKTKALNDLYVELEKERSASEVATNQTMAMIDRLQVEKAAVQMEALQYQRMMEEQLEYDQEALQLLNELMVKREKEKQELEEELQIYRMKVLDYEVKEKMAMLRRSRELRDGSTRSHTSIASYSNCDDSDGLTIEINQEGDEAASFSCPQESGNGNHHIINAPVNTGFYLDESVANFEKERLLILEQLRDLEEKLFALANEEEWHLDDMKPLEQFYEENGKEFDEHFEPSSDLNGGVDDFPNGKHNQESKIIGSEAKRLLLSNTINAEMEGNRVMNGVEEGFDSIVVTRPVLMKFELERKKLEIEGEVNHLYERLQELEADGEFLKHCIGSLKKGDKGLDLLQEILQLLRRLKNVEVRVGSMSDGLVI